MTEAEKSRLRRLVAEHGIYAVLSTLVELMQEQGQVISDPERARLAERVARSIERARDAV